MKNKINLASVSPRRKQLLEQLDLEVIVCAAAIDETIMPGETALEHVERLAQQKAAAAQQYDQAFPLIAADTVVVIDDMILGKPKNYQDYCRNLQKLSARKHQVITGVCLLFAAQQQTFNVITEVKFRELTAEEIDYYWQYHRPLDKAGGYAIQGYAACFVKAIYGSYTNVVGLPLTEVYLALEKL